MSLLQMSTAGAVMILAITVIRALAMSRVPKVTFLALWGAALVRLLAPFSLPSRLSVYSLLERKAAVPADVSPAAARPVVPAGRAAAILPQAASAPGTAISVWDAVWAAGLILCAAGFVLAYWRCRREFQMSLPVENDVSRQWLRAHPLRRPLSIRQSDRISSPLTFGVLRPVILMPRRTDWVDGEALRCVLEHEFVHIQRFDALAKLLLAAAVCVHWFNPLVWGMYFLANRDIELSCDETVVRRFGRDARASYARVLIRMEEARSGLAPLCNYFNKNAIEERITAIMKIPKITIVSLAAAACIVAGTVTVFATSAQSESGGASAAGRGAAAVEATTANTSGGAQAVESGEGLKPDAEYLSAGITERKGMWYYQGKPIAAIYDDDGDIYLDDEAAEDAADSLCLNIRRDGEGTISGVDVITREEFRDRYMNANPPASTLDESTLMSWVDPADGRTYYSFDEGKTFEPLTDEEFEARFPTPDVEWWTYDEYKAWLADEKVQLQSMLGETGWVNGQKFTWTQEEIDELVDLYESILEDMKNGVLYSKSIDGQDDMLMSYDPADVAVTTSEGTSEAAGK